MLLEGAVLTVLENVLSGYIVDVITKKRSARTRAEVIDIVKNELSRAGGMQQQINALTIAVRELDQVVRNDSFLKWRGDLLEVESPRRVINRKPLDVEAAITALRASVQERREELARAEREISKPANPDEIRLVEEAQDGAPKTVNPWQERVIGLQSEVRQERRKARRDQNDE